MPRPHDGAEATLSRRGHLPLRPTPRARRAGAPRRPRHGAGLLAAALLATLAFARAGAAEPLAPRLLVWGFQSGEVLSVPRGIAFDPRDGAIVVANTGRHRVETYSHTGRPLARFVHRVTRPDSTVVDGEPCALAFDRSGRLLVADQLALYVDVLDRRGRPVARLDVPGGHPAALAVGPDGTIYVGTTAEESKVHRFRPDYAPDGTWGEPGGAAGHLFDVTALAVLGDSAVAVACARTDVGVQVFTPAGVYLRGFGSREMGRGNLSLPSGLAATADGRIWVCDEIRGDLQAFDAQGNFLEVAASRGEGAGDLMHPSSLAYDGRGRFAVTERSLGRFQVLAQPDVPGR